MDIIDEVEDNYFIVSNAKLHGGMYEILSSIYCKVLQIFPGVEAARPRSNSGIQALCSLHLALEKTKTILQHCSECSKLYLAITGDSVLIKFEKARSALADSLRRVEDLVPKSMGCQIEEIVYEIEETQFSLDSSEKQVGDGIIALLQRKRKFNSDSNDVHDLESFHQDVCRLGITSSRAALTERRALKKLIEKARVEGDKRKEEIVAFLFYFMRKYSNFFRTEVSDDNDSEGSTTPCSPTVESYNENVNGPGGNGLAFGRQLSKPNSFNFVPSDQRSEHLPFPPEELRCPISLQLMHDPVIISSGQTYERSCIEQWFSDGHNTCPKTQHRLSNFDLTPNYCVKVLISSWCGQNGASTPDAPPECLDRNFWRLALSEGESNSKSVDGTGSCKFKRGVNILSLEDGSFIESEIIECMSTQEEGVEVNLFERYSGFLTILHSEVDVQKKYEVVEEVRHLLKEDKEARIVMGANGFVEALMQFLVTAVDTNNRQDQEVGAMALFNLAVENNRNAEMMLAAGMISILEEMIADSNSHHRSATALYLTLSFLDKAKPIIASSKAVPFLILLLGTENDQRCRHDSLRTVYNLSTSPSAIQHLLSVGIINSLSSLLTLANGRAWIERSIAVLLNIAATAEGKKEMTSNPDLITGLATILDADAPDEQEYAVTCLLTLCTGNDKCSQMILQEGVIPSLVSISVNGKTTRGKEKAKKLLMLFREQRQSDSPTLVTIDHHQQHSNESCDVVVVPVLSEKKVVSSKVVSKRKKVGKILSFLWKSKASQHTRADACRA